MVASRKISALVRAVSVGCAAFGLLVMGGCGNVYVHDEFSKLTMNKSESEIIDSIGKPVSVDESNPQHVTWTYYAKTVDVDNDNKRDAKTLLIFGPDATTHELKVTEVKYERS